MADLAQPEERTQEALTWGQDQAGAVAGQKPIVGIFNPTGSGKLVTVHEANVWPDPAAAVGLHAWRLYDYASMVATGFYVQGVMHNRDSRNGGTNFGPPYPSVQVWAGNDPVQPGVQCLAQGFPINDGTVAKLGYVMVPGTGLVLTRNANNTTLTVSFLASERPLSDSQN